jgi:hypothetical protein
MKFKNAIGTQKNYLNTIEVTPYDGVVGLDYAITCDDSEHSLREVLMCTCNPKTGKRLFIGVEEDNDLSINLIHKSSDIDEVNDFLSAMPLMFQQEWGSESWYWFTNEVREGLHGFSWSAEAGLTSDSDGFIQSVVDFEKEEHLEESDDESVAETGISHSHSTYL